MMIDLTGQQFGDYRLVRLLGTGGFASVYLGQHVHIASLQAAIKILHLVNVNQALFQKEAETMVSLLHPHIVRLLGFSIQPGTNIPFLVMDYAPAGSLLTRHPRETQVPLATVVQYVKEIALALQYAHDHNILHRDIKPENILIGRDGKLLLSDFGLATLSKTGRGSLQVSYGKEGTPYYMAPEMFKGKPEKASDQYSLAVVVYEWLCGTPPFSGDMAIQLAYQHIEEPIPPLRDKLPTLSPRVEAVVLKALAKKPADRFPSVQAFADALKPPEDDVTVAIVNGHRIPLERLQMVFALKDIYIRVRLNELDTLLERMNKQGEGITWIEDERYELQGCHTLEGTLRLLENDGLIMQAIKQYRDRTNDPELDPLIYLDYVLNQVKQQSDYLRTLGRYNDTSMQQVLLVFLRYRILSYFFRQQGIISLQEWLERQRTQADIQRNEKLLRQGKAYD